MRTSPLVCLVTAGLVGWGMAYGVGVLRRFSMRISSMRESTPLARYWRVVSSVTRPLSTLFCTDIRAMSGTGTGRASTARKNSRAWIRARTAPVPAMDEPMRRTGLSTRQDL